MPVALCVLGILSVCQAIQMSARHADEAERPAEHDEQQPTERHLVDDSHLADEARPQHTTIWAATANATQISRRRSGASSIPGELRYQWPKQHRRQA